MGDLKFLQSGIATANGGRFPIDIPPGPYQNFYLRLFGTTDTGQTLAPVDVGRIRLNRFGQDIHGQAFEFYFDYTKQKWGFPPQTMPAAGATIVGARIPAGLKQMPNILDVMSDQELKIFLEFNATTLATRFGANPVTWQLYGDVAPGLREVYQLEVVQQNIQAGASGLLKSTINAKNIGALYLLDRSDKVDQVQITSDGRIVTDNIDDDVLLEYTNLDNEVEASGHVLIEVPFTPAGDLAETRNSNNEYAFTFNGAGTLEMTAFVVKFPSPNSAASAERQRAFLAQKATSGIRIPAGIPNGAVRV
jgi:hypothetical protein